MKKQLALSNIALTTVRYHSRQVRCRCWSSGWAGDEVRCGWCCAAMEATLTLYGPAEGVVRGDGLVLGAPLDALKRPRPVRVPFRPLPATEVVVSHGIATETPPPLRWRESLFWHSTWNLKREGKERTETEFVDICESGEICARDTLKAVTPGR